MKKITAIFLLSVLLFNFAGGLLLFKVQQQINYWQVKEELKNSDKLIKLALNLDEYESSKVNEEEVLLNGKMYDVADIIFKDNTVTLFCLADFEENDLIDSFHEFRQKKSRKGESDLHVLKFLSLLYIQTSQHLTVDNFTTVVSHFSSYNKLFKPAFIAVESPPPKA
ncbi:MAG: hypothetical protein ABI723_17665 [Bacteroidia bacterium]